MRKQSYSTRALQQAWENLQAERPQTRIREAASLLGVSEAELVASGCAGNAVQLDGPWPALLAEIGELGLLMGLTRNDEAVHEKIGLYDRSATAGDWLLLSGHGVNTALLTGLWHAGFAVCETTRIGERRSLQFFDARGEAVYKLYLTEHADQARYQRLVDAHRTAYPPPNLELPADSMLDAADTDTVSGMPEHWQRWFKSSFFTGNDTGIHTSRPIAVSVFAELMLQLADMQLPIQIIVRNQAAIQVHDGPIRNLMIGGPWLNVLDQDFNLHLNQTAIACLRSVNLPHRGHGLQGLQLLNARGQTIASLFGCDDPAGGNPLWRDLLAGLPGETAPC
ncbi:ChuX/HutX family heme-like substrate-binding protein [Methylomonas methanica]|uniref:Hemin-degrading family protein n=1 Tax=Methylomonas methanica (strain DSM 25384 / MC09) TaxID=857087 RepID=G0A7A2_METMM|nr:ChuX/HutX family heme-like substrate-binding protein [Methylomonas methanica]AEF99395.1 hemin-degrading family protein [Methylomonas methanica MC09]